ncbi:Dynein heavy chain 1, axonemal [Caenorhabditis elegans]|uniref:Dynein heavy chain 1, axonemal n=1 Tax=Caenorhabditis elegans TaxID=6239 RepID=U4PEX3_CAEEL|nr:Dynein heavy chain 1, axonemal [Caenorhabditis elegans]CDH93288.1 Dynein heavy chain 1, axonemal [Caenorhabditis elegans]|eukprot:NP_001294497.1 Uncharacterized protein CELE_Y77E11A.7 [Caenorhabditis elegans]
METRKVRTPSAKLLAAKQDEVFEKVIPTAQLTPKSTISAQMAKVPESTTPEPLSVDQERDMTPGEHELQVHQKHHQSPILEEEIDVSNTEIDASVLDDHMDTQTMEIEMEMALKREKIDAQMVLNSDFSVANEVTISSMKYQGRPTPTRKVPYQNEDEHLVTTMQRVAAATSFTGETLNLKSSDLSIPNKAAHFLYFRCYEEHEVQKEFPLTIDETRKGPQNFLVEPRHGLKNTDYYIDSYLWNRGKSTSSKKKIFVEIEGNHVKTSRRTAETAHYVLNWYYSNMENRICKKLQVCWLESLVDNSRASPVLVQYHVNYLSDNPIELRKTPKLYSDTRSVAQELLRSDSPLQTVQRFVETGETDPREIINKKQAYEMRRYVMANARKRMHRRMDDNGVYYDDEMFEEVYYNEPDSLLNPPRHNGGDAARVAQMVCRQMGRRIENRIASMLDSRLGPPKNHAEMLTEWMNTLMGSTSEDYDIVIHNVVNSMKKQLDEMLGEPPQHHTEYMDEAGGPSSTSSMKRMKMMNSHGAAEDDEDDDDGGHHHVVGNSGKPRFEGERYIFDGEEYVEEEVIAEELTEVPASSANGEQSDDVKYNERGAQAAAFFFRQATEGVAHVETVDQ